ncbi:MAG: hypothetical protein IJD36_05820, partial [Clostridia bacterium]|nr:hypothetical protein [Clostridia bacterium]
AWSSSAAGGGYSENDKAQRSILCERSLRATKIGYRKKKQVNHDVTGIELGLSSYQNRTI